MVNSVDQKNGPLIDPQVGVLFDGLQVEYDLAEGRRRDNEWNRRRRQRKTAAYAVVGTGIFAWAIIWLVQAILAPAPPPAKNPGPNLGSKVHATKQAPPVTTRQIPVPQLRPASLPEGVATFLQTWHDSFLKENFNLQMECYAPLVEDYFRKQNLTRAGVRREREGLVKQYGHIRQFRISNTELITSSPERVIVRFRTQWELTGGGYFAGEDMEKLTLVQSEGKWLITREEEPVVYWVKKQKARN